MAKQANPTANHLHLGPNPFSMVYIGPPAVFPSESVSRYLSARVHSAYFNDVPKNAVIHIQNNAPGPPIKIAVATPAIFPIPTVAANAVDRALK